MLNRWKRNKPPRGDISERDALGRVFSVRQESWRLDQDPKTTKPEVTVVASRRSAADAADLAREAAAAFRKRGFHKPSRSWWGVEDGWFHRFRVHGPGAGKATLAVVLGLTATATALFVAGRSRRRRKDAG